MQPRLSRRVLLAGAAAGTAGLLVPRPTRVSARRTPLRDPFTLGVASGDPSADGFVLWTRLAVRPLDESGLGGMPNRVVEVEWQLAADERFRSVVRTGVETARPEAAHSVHVELAGLEPGREYFYRFRADGRVSPVGRTRTAPAAGTFGGLTFATAACAHYEHGYYTAYRRLAEEEPDLVVHLGDYLYEYERGGYNGVNGPVRRHIGEKCRTLADYRARHAQYKSDPDLRAAHAVAPWLVVFDDHEVENNWAGPVSSTGAEDFEARRRAGLRAYYENMPLRRSSMPRGTAMRLHRRVEWGSLASFHLLDTRQFRDDQACFDGVRAGCDDVLDPGRTLLGADQRDWLLAGLRGSGARWNLIGQQVVMAQHDGRLGPGREVNMDGWDGYPAERTRLLAGIRASGAANPVVLTGDAHIHHAADLRADFDDPDSARVAVELVTSSIASDGDGYRDDARMAALRAENPHIAYVDQRRGYIVCRVRPDEMRADFRTLDYISRRGAPAKTSARFTVPSGEHTLA